MFKNRDFEIACNHLLKARNESKDATKDILKSLNEVLKILQNNGKDTQKAISNIKKSIEKLQYQDILAQRLKKVEDFLKEIDKKIDTNKDEDELNEFAWENEVAQDDIDDILKSYGL